MGIPAELELLKHPEPGLRQSHPAPGKSTSASPWAGMYGTVP